METIENKRLIEENKIFDEEMKLANEYKSEIDKVNLQLNKLDSTYRRKISQIIKEKNLIKVSLPGCSTNYNLFLSLILF